MRRFVSFGPAFVVLLTAGAVLVALPGLMMRISAARTRESVALARQQLDDDDVLERLNKATQHVADAVEPSVVHLEVAFRRMSGASGSGWVFDDDGHIITNAHVVGPASRVSVQFFDGRVEMADVIGADPLTDVAVIKVPKGSGDYLVPARRGTGDRVHRGDRVFAFGSPFNFKFSMSEGIVSGLGRTARAGGGEVGITNFIQTDAAVNPGNSGGPLVDVNGRVVGMNVAIATAENSAGGNEGQSAGISFAIPLATIESRAEQIIAVGHARSGFLGVGMADLAEEYGKDGYEGKGVRVERVEPGKPADKAGMREGDIIVAIDNEPVDSRDVVRATIGVRRPGTNAKVRVYRNGEFKEFDVTVGAMPDDVLASQYASLFADEFGALFNLDKPSVRRVLASSAAADAGLHAGDTITKVEDTPVHTFEEAMIAMADAGIFRGVRVSVTVIGRAEEPAKADPATPDAGDKPEASAPDAPKADPAAPTERVIRLRKSQ